MSVIFYSLIIYYSITYVTKIVRDDDEISELCIGLKRIDDTFSLLAGHL